MICIEAFRQGDIYDISPLTKRLRAAAIAEEIQRHNYSGCVCFSSGTALRYLREAVPYVLGISAEGGDLLARRWFSAAEIKFLFPLLYDGTSGHLPEQVLQGCAAELGRMCQAEDKEYRVSSGSGESAYIAKYAFKGATIVPVFDQSNPHTYWEAACDFNKVLQREFPVAYIKTAQGEEQLVFNCKKE